MITPTITRRQNNTVSSLAKRVRYSLIITHTHTRRGWITKLQPATEETKAQWLNRIVLTYGVSNMTLHTLAIVLRQSVVFSTGSSACWSDRESKMCWLCWFVLRKQWFVSESEWETFLYRCVTEVYYAFSETNQVEFIHEHLDLFVYVVYIHLSGCVRHVKIKLQQFYNHLPLIQI